MGNLMGEVTLTECADICLNRYPLGYPPCKIFMLQGEDCFSMEEGDVDLSGTIEGCRFDHAVTETNDNAPVTETNDNATVNETHGNPTVNESHRNATCFAFTPNEISRIRAAGWIPSPCRA